MLGRFACGRERPDDAPCHIHRVRGVVIGKVESPRHMCTLKVFFQPSTHHTGCGESSPLGMNFDRR